MANQSHHRTPRYQHWAPRITHAAAANPATRCNGRECHGRTLAEHEPAQPGGILRWTAGHLIAGSHTWQPWIGPDLAPPGDWLAPVVSRCNIGDGNRNREPPSGWTA